MSNQPMKKILDLCQFYQTGECGEQQPVHHNIGKDGNIHYYTHLCDVCSRLRNAYSPHMGANCEIIVEIDKMTNTKLNYNSKLLTPKKQR
jgi:hypothetical protein